MNSSTKILLTGKLMRFGSKLPSVTLPLIVLMVLALSSCSKDNEPDIDYRNYVYDIVCEGDALDDEGILKVPAEGETFVLDLKAVAQLSDGNQIEAPYPKFEYRSYDYWFEVNIEGSKLTITVPPLEERNVEDRTGLLWIETNYWYTCHQLELRVEQEAEWDTLVFKSSTFWYDSYETDYGWCVNKLGSSFVRLEFYVFDDDEITTEVSDPTMTIEFISEEPDQVYKGRSCKVQAYAVKTEINTTGSTREYTFTFRSKSGAEYTRRVVQEYHSIGASCGVFELDGTWVRGWECDYRSYDCYLRVKDMCRGGVTAVIDGSRVTLKSVEKVEVGEYYDEYMLTFNIPVNDGVYDYRANIYPKSLTTGEIIGPYIIYQKSKYGNSGGSGSGGGSSDSTDDTSGYTISSTSVCAIYATDNSSSGTKYTKNWYKWVSSTGKVILSSSRSSKSGWVGVASNNYDSSCKGYSVGSYSYKYTDYSPVGGTWYYYFN